MRRGAPAFTLLETMLALMIFSTAVVALVEAVNQLGTSTLHQRRESEVQERMRSLLTERTRLPLPPEGEETKLQEGDVTYIVRHQKLDLQNHDGQPLNEFYEVRVIAEWMEGRERQQASADTWLYPPLFQQAGGAFAPVPVQPFPPPPVLR